MKSHSLSKHGAGLFGGRPFLQQQAVTSASQESGDPAREGFSRLLTPLPCVSPWRQEQLLLSVLPRYIAIELKSEVIKRLSKPESKEKNESNGHNFHSLYIRQHKNVR